MPEPKENNAAGGASGADRLVARNIGVRFGGLVALDDISLELGRHEVLGLIGPNGAGKTTFVNVLSGFQKKHAGTIELNGQRIERLEPQLRARRGLARTFQAVRLFPDLSVAANVEVPAVAIGMSRVQARGRARELLDWVNLSNMHGKLARELPYSAERKVGIARALALEPQFLLLDEPAAGMHETEAEELLERISEIPRQFNCGVLLIEHNMRLIMAGSHRLHVLQFGRTLATGTPDEIKKDARVIEAYLGSETEG